MDAACTVQQNEPKLYRVVKKLLDARAETRYWSSVLLINKAVENNWLQVNVEGLVGDLQVLGARVEIQLDDSEQFRWVGQFEGAHFSQGHYRIYFGLGESEIVNKVIVRWPDGSSNEYGPFSANQHIILRKRDAVSK